jgi:Zn-dependent M28 family amino/carboxypeptidase
VLVNAHLDSTLPSPGAADDLSGCSVMVGVLRAMVASPQPLRNSVIFLFNGAEESLQDASHLYITKHETKDTVKAVINLEAAGTTGKEIVFQATSEAMIKAYQRVPWPYGTVLATEIFSTGIIVSE